MRLLAKHLESAKAKALTRYFVAKGINASFEEKESGDCSVWIYDEEQFEEAQGLLRTFEGKEEDEIAQEIAQAPPQKEPESKSFQMQLKPLLLMQRKTPVFTFFVIFLCSFLYFWNANLETTPGQQWLQFTRVSKALVYDFPPAMDTLIEKADQYGISSDAAFMKAPKEEQEELLRLKDAPYWRGVYSLALGGKSALQSKNAPLFTDIAKGDVWRILSPAFLHVSFFHLLFNMLWVFILSRMIEQRAGIGALIGLVLISAAISNTLQYIMSGPLFMGYSGVVMAMAGFIWARQKKAPWEGYPLQKGVVLFLTIYVLALTGLQIVSFVLTKTGALPFDARIANTAHISGAILGILYGKILPMRAA